VYLKWEIKSEFESTHSCVCLGFLDGAYSMSESRAPQQPSDVRVTDFTKACVGFHVAVFLLKPLVHCVAMATLPRNPVASAFVCCKLSVFHFI